MGLMTISTTLSHRISFFLDSRLQYESLEGLMDFLAFLVQKFGQTSGF